MKRIKAGTSFRDALDARVEEMREQGQQNEAISAMLHSLEKELSNGHFDSNRYPYMNSIRDIILGFQIILKNIEDPKDVNGQYVSLKLRSICRLAMKLEEHVPSFRQHEEQYTVRLARVTAYGRTEPEE